MSDDTTRGGYLPVDPKADPVRLCDTCRHTCDGERCWLPAGHDGLHVADFGEPDGFVTWPEDGSGAAS